jgi:organic hydroperoxide reductase OsmC/OhrA
MSTYTAETIWTRAGASPQEFLASRYSRRHLLRFDGGVEVAGSSSPHTVRPPYSDPAAIDPEEAFVSSLSSCHMLWFLSLAAKQGFCVDAYFDAASGELAEDASGRMVMTVVTLRPRVTCSGDAQPAPEQVHRLHHEAHEACFIANSVKTEVRVEPLFA